MRGHASLRSVPHGHATTRFPFFAPYMRSTHAIFSSVCCFHRTSERYSIQLLIFFALFCSQAHIAVTPHSKPRSVKMPSPNLPWPSITKSLLTPQIQVALTRALDHLCVRIASGVFCAWKLLVNKRRRIVNKLARLFRADLSWMRRDGVQVGTRTLNPKQ